MSDGDDWSAQDLRALDFDCATWMPFGRKCGDDVLGVWLWRHGLELVRSPHQASCFTEDEAVALFCKAYKSMIKPSKADLSSGRLSKSHVFTLLVKVPRTHKTFVLVQMPPSMGP